MKTAFEMVQEFHEKYGYPVNVCPNPTDELKFTYKILGDMLIGIAKTIEENAIHYQNQGDPTLYRLHLNMEELGELCIAFSEGDDVKIFDAEVDLAYVVTGLAVTFGLPLPEGFAEVHRSNMTKAHPSEGGGARMRRKGSDYSPPELEQLLFRSRNNETV